jgi:hypothetical protein
VRATLFISEAKAQQLAVRVRQQVHAGALATALHRWIAPRLDHLLTGHARHRLRIVHPSMRPGSGAAALAQRIAPATAAAFAARLRGWVVQAYAEALKSQAQQIVAATEDAGDGITLRFTIERPPGLKALCDAALGQGAAPLPSAFAAAPAALRVQVTSGQRDD